MLRFTCFIIIGLIFSDNFKQLLYSFILCRYTFLIFIYFIFHIFIHLLIFSRTQVPRNGLIITLNHRFRFLRLIHLSWPISSTTLIQLTGCCWYWHWLDFWFYFYNLIIFAFYFYLIYLETFNINLICILTTYVVLCVFCFVGDVVEGG